MLKTLIVTLREGIEAALALGIIMVHLRREGRAGLARFVRWGFWSAVAASLAGAIVLGTLTTGSDVMEGALMIAAGLLVVSMIIWMARHARGMRRDIEDRLDRAAGRDGPLAKAALFSLTFLMIFREGIETVLMLAAVSFTSDSILSFAGGVLGIAAAVVFYFAFVRGSLLVDVGRFFKVTGVVLSIFAVQLVLGGIHELAEAGVLPLGRREMQILGPIVKGETLFLAALLTLPLVVLLVKARAPGGGAAQDTNVTPPEARKLRAKARSDRRWRFAAGSAGLLIAVSLTAAFAFGRLPAEIDPPRMLEQAGGRIRIPVAGLNDGHLHRFGVALDGAIVRFFVITGAGGRLVASFDACQICGTDGYVERNGRVICLTCAADIVTATVGVPGGCNPIPLRSRIEGDTMGIDVADLASMAASFRDSGAGRRPPPAR